MTVARRYQFALADAVLSGGAALVGASGPLPARITGAANYGLNVLALNPTGYWRLNEPSGITFADGSPNNRPLVANNGSTPSRSTGHGRGGDTGGCAAPTGVGGGFIASGNYPEHRIVAGTPFTALLWSRALATGMSQFNAIGTQSNPGTTNSPGWSLRPSYNNSGWWEFMVVNAAGTAYRYGRITPIGANDWYSTRPQLAALRYTGGALTAQASWNLSVGGVTYPFTVFGGSSPADVGAGGALWVLNSTLNIYAQDAAVFAGVYLSDAQLLALAGATPCGRARWTLPSVAYSRTFRSFALPGSLSRNVNTTESRLGVRAYYSLDGGATRTEFDPGDDLAAGVAIPAGTALTLDADLTHHHIEDLPWIADASGGGPVVVWEEADPPPVTVQVPYVIDSLTVTVEDRSSVNVTVQDLDEIRVVVED